MACTWFGEISSRSCLTALPSPAWVLLSKIYKPFPGSLHSATIDKCLMGYKRGSEDEITKSKKFTHA